MDTLNANSLNAIWSVNIQMPFANDWVKKGGLFVFGLIVFAESGLLVGFFLPGDSLLFAVGALAAQGFMRIELIIPLLMCAAIIGDNLNYWIGRKAGGWIVNQRWFKRDYLAKTEAFFVKHGGKAIILARFVPIVRTFAPFVAGVAQMSRKSFTFYDVTGGRITIELRTVNQRFLDVRVTAPREYAPWEATCRELVGKHVESSVNNPIEAVAQWRAGKLRPLCVFDDERMPLQKGEKPKLEMVRFRTLGCYPLTGAIESDATSLLDIVEEMLVATSSERQGRVIDKDGGDASMEKKKQEGYF